MHNVKTRFVPTCSLGVRSERKVSNGDLLKKMTFNHGVKKLDRINTNNYTNMAQLKELMTAPPMTAEQHAAITRKRIKDRRMVEEARELKSDRCNQFEGT